MSSNDKALQAKFKKILDELLKEPENRVCADCKTKSPRWASSSLGVFICIRCSGIHRNLGVHISFVRSVNLDSWTGKEVRMMQKWGNRRANMYWEAKFNNESIRPDEQSTMQEAEKFIRMKYEQQKWVDPNFDVSKLDSTTNKTTNNTTNTTNTTNSNTHTNQPDHNTSNQKKSHSRHHSKQTNEINNNNQHQKNNNNNVTNNSINIVDFGDTNNNNNNNDDSKPPQHNRRKSIEELREIAIKIPDNDNSNKNKSKVNKEPTKQRKGRVDSVHSLKDNIAISSNNGIPDDFWDEKPQSNNNNNNSNNNNINNNNNTNNNNNNINNNDIDIFSNMDISNSSSNNNSTNHFNSNNNDDLMNFDIKEERKNTINSQEIDDLFNVAATTISSPTVNINTNKNQAFLSSNGMDNIDVYMNISPLHKPKVPQQMQQRAVAMNRMMNMIPQPPSNMDNMMGGMGMMGSSNGSYNMPPPMNLGGTGMMNQGMMNMGMRSNVIGGNMGMGTSNNAFHNRRQQNKVPPKYY